MQPHHDASRRLRALRGDLLNHGVPEILVPLQIVDCLGCLQGGVQQAVPNIDGRPGSCPDSAQPLPMILSIRCRSTVYSTITTGSRAPEMARGEADEEVGFFELAS